MNLRTLLAALIGRENYEMLHVIREFRRAGRTDREGDERRAAFYRRWLRRDDLIFDIGANRGNRTRVFAALGARVVTVEPQRHCARALAWLYRGNPQVVVIGAGAGRDDAPKRITQFSTDVLSSMNPDWIANARQSGRFGELRAVREITVPGVTLDQLIARHGRPVFTKIDVEGYEAEVLAGLSQSCGTVSFEITPELSAISLACVARLEALGYTRFQFSPGESMALNEAWEDSATMRERLRQLASAPADFGDVYALAPGLPG